MSVKKLFYKFTNAKKYKEYKNNLNNQKKINFLKSGFESQISNIHKKIRTKTCYPRFRQKTRKPLTNAHVEQSRKVREFRPRSVCSRTVSRHAFIVSSTITYQDINGMI